MSEIKNINCKYCNAKKSTMISKCPNPNCPSNQNKKIKWNNPVYTRKYKYRTKNKLK